jgi:hypothetical protein
VRLDTLDGGPALRGEDGLAHVVTKVSVALGDGDHDAGMDLVLYLHVRSVPRLGSSGGSGDGTSPRPPDPLAGASASSSRASAMRAMVGPSNVKFCEQK